MAESEDAFYDDGSRVFRGKVSSGYPHQNIGNSDAYTVNKVGVPEGEWYVEVRPHGSVSVEQIVEEAETAGFTTAVKEYDGEKSPRLRTNKSGGKKSVFVW